jgi:hypothetical protein
MVTFTVAMFYLVSVLSSNKSCPDDPSNDQASYNQEKLSPKDKVSNNKKIDDIYDENEQEYGIFFKIIY